MKKEYQSRPRKVLAEQWIPGKDVDGVFDDDIDGYYVVTIHEQKAYLKAGDWVISEPDNIHNYPCRSGIFEKNYYV